MIRLKNPYANYPDYNCFGCSPTNHQGLRMKFFEDGDEIVCTWNPDHHFQGFKDILHGGIQATMMDEIASWVIMVKLDTAGVTFRLSTRYRKPVRLSAGAITLRAKLLQHQRRIATIEVWLLDGDGNRCSEGTMEYFIFDRDKATREMHYPGKEAFY